MAKLKRIIGNRRLTKEEAAANNKIREQTAKELPELVEQHNLKMFKQDMKALRDALAKAQKSAAELPIGNGRAYYVEQCEAHLRSALNEIEEVDGKNGYFDYVEAPQKIQKA